MTWKDILKANCGTEKMGCKGCPKCDMEKYCGKEREDPFHDAEPPVPIPGMEKKLVGNQKRIDADKDGKITGKDFAMLREKKAQVKCPKCKGKGCAHCDNKGYHISKSEDVAKSPTSIYNRLSNELKQKVKDLVYNQNLSLADAVMKVTRESRQQKPQQMAQKPITRKPVSRNRERESAFRRPAY